MKRTLALLLALIMCIGLFAACGGDKDETKTPDNSTDGEQTPGTNDDGQGGSTTPPDGTQGGTPDTTTPEKKTVEAILDVTDGLSVAIENIGASGNSRVAFVAEAGEVQISDYNLSGSRRKKSYTFKWADLGLEGESWEYLGATFVIDITDGNNPKIDEKPTEKTTFAYEGYNNIPFEGNTKVKLPCGTYDMSVISHCAQRNRNLINEGGQYIVKWGDKSIVDKNSANWFDKYPENEWYIFITCKKFDQVGFSSISQEPSTYSPNYTVPADKATVFTFGSHMWGAYNAYGTFESMLEEGLGKDVFSIEKLTKPVGYGYVTSWELYELFDAEVQKDPEAVKFNTGHNGREVEAALTQQKFDYIVLQTGRDRTVATEGDLRNVYAAVKIAKLAVAKKPDVKILIVAPYGNNATFADLTGVTNHDQHVALINAEAQKAVDAIKAAGIANVSMVSVGDCFEAYVSGGGKLGDLFQVSDGDTSRKNAGNRANAKGAYITACAIYTALTGKSPVGLKSVGEPEPVLITIETAIAQADATALQNLVKSVLLP